jgi:hypothetical protein
MPETRLISNRTVIDGVLYRVERCQVPDVWMVREEGRLPIGQTESSASCIVHLYPSLSHKYASDTDHRPDRWSMEGQPAWWNCERDFNRGTIRCAHVRAVKNVEGIEEGVRAND